MKILISFTLLLLVSCAQVIPKKGNYKKVSYSNNSEDALFYYENDISPSEYNNSRSIASSAPEQSYTKNKQVYFQALWQQSLTLAKYLNLEPINNCPAFHQTVVSSSMHAHNLKKKVNITSADLVLYPILALKDGSKSLYMEKEIEPKMKDYISNYYKSIKSEVKELCNTGVSDSFYTFQNTIKHYASKKKAQSANHQLNSYLKIPVFANLYLIDSLKSQSGALTDSETAILATLDIKWFESYLYKLRQRRESLVSLR